MWSNYGIQRISTIFKIDTSENITDVRARAPHPKLKNQAIRIIKLLKNEINPGMQLGKPIIVPYSLPIIYIKYKENIKVKGINISKIINDDFGW